MKLLTLHINITKINEFDNGEKLVRMVEFGGEARGEIFNGKIMRGGVDTQIIDKKGKGNLSARYMIKGNDSNGNKCFIYVSNNVEYGSEFTVPSIITDCKELKKYEKANLIGIMRNDKEGFFIDIYSE